LIFSPADLGLAVSNIRPPKNEKNFNIGLQMEMNASAAEPQQPTSIQYNYKIPLHGETNHNTKAQGSPLWMAPEVFTQNYGFKADVFSFGMVMYELLTCKLPWHSDPRGLWISQVMRAIVAGDRPVIDEPCLIHAPEGFVTLMKQCWRTNPKERPTFDEVLLTLHEL
jgi:serine/threonine protein kinase